MRSLFERTPVRTGSRCLFGWRVGKRDAPYTFFSTSHRASSGVGALLKILSVGGVARSAGLGWLPVQDPPGSPPLSKGGHYFL